MFKFEMLCSSCDSHFIVINKSDEDIKFCPYCSTEITFAEDEEDSEDQEKEFD